MNDQVDKIEHKEIEQVIDKNKRLIEALKLLNEKISTVSPQKQKEASGDSSEQQC